MNGLLAVIADRCQRVKWQGDRFTASCPNYQAHSHEDRSKSFSARATHDRVLLHCHAGCSIDDLCRALDLEQADLFLEKKSHGPNGHSKVSPPAPTQRKIVAVYPYPDEKGETLFEGVRYEPKSFAQRHKVNGEYKWNLNGVRLVLYRLPAVLKAETVYVVEGEKDVATLEKLGLVATTNPMGALKWREEYTTSLEGKKLVVVLGDADEIGRKHAAAVASSCQARGIPVKLLELPFAKDVSEWIGNGHTRGDLEHVVYEAPLWAPATVEPPADAGLDFPEFMKQSFADSGVPLLEGLINREGRVFVIARPKHLKSWLALSIAFEASMGLRVFGRFAPATAVRVLYCQFEDPPGAIQERCKKLVESHDGLAPLPGYFTIKATGGISCNIMEDEAYAQFQRWCELHKPELLVLDVMRKIFVGNLNDTKDVSPFLDRLDELKNRFHCAILLVHYSPKNAETVSAAGSVYFEGWYDTEIKIDKKRKQGGSGTRILADLEFETKGKPIDDLTLCYDETAKPILSVSEDVVGDYVEICKKHLVKEGWGINEVARVLQLGYQTARRLIEQWEKKEICEFVACAKGHRGGMKTWKWSASENEPEERY